MDEEDENNDLNLFHDAIQISICEIIPGSGWVEVSSGSCRTVEHMLGVTHAVLGGLKLPTEARSVLELLQTPVFCRVSDWTRVWWVAVGRKCGIGFRLLRVLHRSFGLQTLFAFSSSSLSTSRKSENPSHVSIIQLITLNNIWTLRLLG